MSLDISTDIPCSASVQVSVTAGAGTNVEDIPPSVVTAQCEAGHIGTLTLVPNADKSARITLRVVLAPNGNVEGCNAQNKYAGCIVARRALSYVSARALRVPVSMYARCKDVPCTATSTCARTGLCVAAECSVRGVECVVEDERPDTGPSADAAKDALATNDGSATLDGSSNDGGRDAGDAGLSSGGTVGVFCPAMASLHCLVNDYCCYDAMTATGSCASNVSDCINNGRRPLRCDDTADCSQQVGAACCADASDINGTSGCVTVALTCTGAGRNILCANLADCPAGSGFTQCAPYFGPYKRCI